MNTQFDQFGRPVWPRPELYDDPSPNALSLAALICGILSLLTICVGGAIIPAALGILLALLSRKTRMCGQAKIGFFMSIGSLGLYVLALLLLIGSLALTGVLGPITEKALQTDFTDAASVAEFQEETLRLLDSLMERYSAFLPEEAPAETPANAACLSASKLCNQKNPGESTQVHSPGSPPVNIQASLRDPSLRSG